MHIAHHAYSLLDVDVVTLADGEVLDIVEAAANQKVYGVFVYTGRSEVVPANGQVWIPTGHFVPNTINQPCAVQAVGETKWLCASQNDNTRREVQELVVATTATLPAGWGFLVLDGSVVAEGKTANQFQFFRPRDTDVAVQGTGVLLLVR